MTGSSQAKQPTATGWLSGKPFLKWGFLALIQIGLISLPLIDRLQVQATGSEVTLELVPVDPRDLLRGDYVIINLAIGTMPVDVPGAQGLAAGDTVFVELEKGSDGLARPVKIARERSAAGSLAIQGLVTSATGEDIRVDYGIDAFFLPEGEGLVIERMDSDKIRLVVSVAEDGRSLPLRLLVNGKPFKSDAVF